MQVKNSADADGAEEADEKRLLLLFNLANLRMHGENCGQATEEEDQDAEKDEPIQRYDRIIEEGGPGTDGAKPDEDRARHVSKAIIGP